jgi:hypothetical protein
MKFCENVAENQKISARGKIQPKIQGNLDLKNNNF